jgi:hypothetical protein
MRGGQAFLSITDIITKMKFLCKYAGSSTLEAREFFGNY